MYPEAGEEIAGLTKLLAALVEHSSEWLVAKMAQNDVQALLGLILRLTGWEGTGGVDEQISEVSNGRLTYASRTFRKDEILIFSLHCRSTL